MSVSHDSEYTEIEYRFVPMGQLSAALAGARAGQAVHFPQRDVRPAAERFVVRIPESMTPRRWPEYKSPWPLVLCVGNPERRGGDVVLMPPLDVFEVIIDPGE